jgi:MFS family permease
MMKLELFKLRNFWVGNVIATAISFGMLGIFFPMTIFLQGVLGFSPIRAGLTMTPMSLMIMIAAPFAGRLTDRIGARWIMVTGASLMGIGILFMITRVDLETNWVHLLPALTITGLGMGLTFSPMTAAAMRDVPPRIAGSASGILNTMRNIGQVLGIAVLGSFLQNRVGAHVSDRLEPLPIDPALKEQTVEFAQQSQFDLLGGILPQDQIGVALNAIQTGFIEALHNTFFVGAMTCVIAAGFALMIRNPISQPATAPNPAPEKAVPVAAD